MSSTGLIMSSIAYSEKSVSSISEVLAKLMKFYGGLSGSELASRVGLPSQTINRILSGFVQDPRTSTLVNVADYFGITVDQLIGKQPLPQDLLQHGYEALQPAMIIPLFSLGEPIVFQREEAFYEGRDWFQWAKNPDSIGKNNFAIRIINAELEPVFTKGTILVIDPDLEPQNEDFALVVFTDNQAITVKKILLNQPDNYFLPIRDGLKILSFKEMPHQILGVVIEAHVDLRKKHR